MDVKPGYKETEVGTIPVDWEVKPLGSLASLYQPVTISAKQLTDAGFPVYGANGVIGFYGKSNHDTWQVTVTCRGSTCGTVNRTVDHSWITGNAMVLNCDQNRAINKEFFYHLLCGQDLSDCITGTGQPQIVRSPLASFCVPIPPTRAEQEAIAEALGDADALIESLEQLLVKKRRLKQGAMQDLLTDKRRLPGLDEEWEVKRLGDLGNFLKGSGVTKDNSFSGSLACVRYGEIYTRHNDYIKTFYSWISSQVAATATRLRYGDVLFAGSGETKEEIGKCVAFVSDCEAYAGGDIIVFRTEKADPLFLGYYLNTAPISRQKASRGQGDAVVHISATALADVQCRLPGIAEQTAIATILSDMDAELASLDEKLTKARSLKQGMMQELLTGRIRLV